MSHRDYIVSRHYRNDRESNGKENTKSQEDWNVHGVASLVPPATPEMPNLFRNPEPPMPSSPKPAFAPKPDALNFEDTLRA